MRLLSSGETFWQFLERNGVNDTMGISDEVGQGWWPLLSKMFKELKSEGWQGTLSQVKEKFGLLRVYLDSYDESDKWAQIVDRAESDSGRICEPCGAPAKCEWENGWARTECQACKEYRFLSRPH